MDKKKWFTSAGFCIVDIAEPPTIAARFRLGKKISGNGRHFDIFIDQSSSDSRAGGQENGSRSGTEATAQIAGFAKAVQLRSEELPRKLAHMADIRAYCRERLLSIDGVVAVGQGEAPHILMVSLVGYPSANVVTDLGSQGICLSAGSACHRGKLSHVVTALGLDKRTANGVLRVSFGPETTFADIDALYAALLQHKNTRFPML